jgi:hypothetical protein
MINNENSFSSLKKAGYSSSNGMRSSSPNFV